MGLGVLWDPFPAGFPGGFAPGSLGIPGRRRWARISCGLGVLRRKRNLQSLELWESPPPQEEFKNNILKPEFSSWGGEEGTEP